MTQQTNFHLLDHPLVQHKMTLLRDKRTGKKLFKELLSEITMMLVFEATRDLATREIDVETPMRPGRFAVLGGKKLALVPILRAGLGMLDGALKLIPCAKVGHIGLERNEETLEPSTYYVKFPPNSEQRVFLTLDPMLATGGSAAAAIDAIKDRGIKNIKFVCVISAPEGVRAFSERHPDVDIHTAALDDGLNEHGYILPGLGDAGDRLFGTV